MVEIEKEYIMKSVLNSLREHAKLNYRVVTDRDLANIDLGELHGFEICFNIVASRGSFSDEARKINSEFTKELEEIRQILVKKFELGEFK